MAKNVINSAFNTQLLSKLVLRILPLNSKVIIKGRYFLIEYQFWLVAEELLCQEIS